VEYPPVVSATFAIVYAIQNNTIDTRFIIDIKEIQSLEIYLSAAVER